MKTFSEEVALFYEKLTLDLVWLLDFIKPNGAIPKNIAHNVVGLHRQRLRAQLDGLEIYAAALRELKAELKKQFYTSQICAGGHRVCTEYR